MIIDTLDRIARYRGLSPAFDTAVDFLEKGGLDKYPAGRTVIDGDNVFVNVSEKACTKTGPKYECHAKYADLQLILAGKETFALGTGGEEPIMDPVRDFAACGADTLCTFTLSAGWFAVFFPGEKHAPGIIAEAELPVRKMVVKILCGQETRD